MLVFPDNTKIGVVGLDGIMAALLSEGRDATDETSEEIIQRLEAAKNHIPSSESVRREYAYVLLKEYRKYVRSATEGTET